MKDFGEWVREVRTKQGFDLRTFGRRTSVDPSTISRIENGRTQVTLYTAIRICVGIGITLQQFSESLDYKIIALEKMAAKDVKTVPVLTLQDLENFMNCLVVEPGHALNILAGLIEMVRPIIKPGALPIPIVGPLSPAHFLFLLSPHPLFKVTLKYPPDISADQILRIYQHGGILNLMDVGAYLRDLRHQSKATVVGFTAVSKRSAAVRTKLELGAIENIKLSDVLELDDQLGSRGEIIAFYWDAITLNVKVADLKVSLELVNLLVIVCRWLQSDLEFGPPTWLNNLRQSLEEKRILLEDQPSKNTNFPQNK